MGWLARAFGGSARGPRDVDTALRSALHAVLDRNLDLAEEQLVRAVGMDADGIDSYLALARLYRTRGEVGRAIRVHQNLLLRDDLSSKQRRMVLADLGADFRQGGFLQRAVASYEGVLAEDRRHLESLRALVPLLAKTRNYTRAIELSRRLAKLEGVDRSAAEARLYVEMAEAAHAEGDHDRARRTAKRALRRDEKCIEAWRLLGSLEAERGRPKAALAAWAEIPRLDRGSGPLVYRQLEATYAALGRTREFETYIRGILERHPEDIGARRALAALLGARGEIDAAVAELSHLLRKDGDDLGARAALGRMLLSENRTADAMREYRALIDALERRGLLGDEDKPE
jgi:lipopolysaccharide biosynthesis regulator YciM